MNTRWGDLSISSPMEGGWSSTHQPHQYVATPDTRYDLPPTPPQPDNLFDIQILQENDPHDDEERYITVRIPLSKCRGMVQERQRTMSQDRQRTRSQERQKPRLSAPGQTRPESSNNTTPISPPATWSIAPQFPTHQAYNSPNPGFNLSPVDEQFAKTGPSRHVSPVTNQDVRSMIEAALAGMDNLILDTNRPPLEGLSNSTMSSQNTFTRPRGQSSTKSTPNIGYNIEYSPPSDHEVFSRPVENTQPARPQANTVRLFERRARSSEGSRQSTARSGSVERPATSWHHRNTSLNSTQRWHYEDREAPQQAPMHPSTVNDFPETSFRPRASSKNSRSPSLEPARRNRANSSDMSDMSSPTISDHHVESRPLPRPIDTTLAPTASRNMGLYNEIEDDYMKLRRDLDRSSRKSKQVAKQSDASTKATSSTNREHSAPRRRAIAPLKTLLKRNPEEPRSAAELRSRQEWDSEINAHSTKKTSPTMNSNSVEHGTAMDDSSEQYQRHARHTSDSASIIGNVGSPGFPVSPIATFAPAGPAPKELVPSHEEIWG